MGKSRLWHCSRFLNLLFVWYVFVFFLCVAGGGGGHCKHCVYACDSYHSSLMSVHGEVVTAFKKIHATIEEYFSDCDAPHAVWPAAPLSTGASAGNGGAVPRAPPMDIQVCSLGLHQQWYCVILVLVSGLVDSVGLEGARLRGRRQSDHADRPSSGVRTSCFIVRPARAKTRAKSAI